MAQDGPNGTDRPVVGILASQGIARWRQRLSAGLFVLGGLALLVSLFLPWIVVIWPADHGPDPTFIPYTRSPIGDLASTFGYSLAHGDVFNIVVYAAMVVLPLVFIALGALLLVRRDAVRARWKVLALVGALVCGMVFALEVVEMAFATFDSGAVARVEGGNIVARLALFAPIIASLLMPSRKAGP